MSVAYSVRMRPCGSRDDRFRREKSRFLSFVIAALNRPLPPCGKRWKRSGSNIIGRERSDSESWRMLEFMLIHTKLPAGQMIYPQLTQFPTNYPDFLAAFRGGQTVDNNTYLTTGNAVQT